MAEKATSHAKHMKLLESRSSTGGVHHLKGKETPSQQQRKPTCHRCGVPHLAPACRFINEKCRSCGKIGHISKVCGSRGKEKQGSIYQQSLKDSTTSHHRTNKIDSSAHTTYANPSDTNAYTMLNISSRSAPIIISLTLNGHPTTMELDTGASYSVVGETSLRSILADSVSIDHCSDIILQTYMDEILPLLGNVTVTVADYSQVVLLSL